MHQTRHRAHGTSNPAAPLKGQASQLDEKKRRAREKLRGKRNKTQIYTQLSVILE